MKIVASLLFVAAAAMTLPASAQFAKPEDAIKYRKASLVLLAAHFGRIGNMANGKAPFDAKVAAENAELVVTLAKLPWAGFAEGTDQGETKAKPEIWKEQAKFKDLSEKMMAETVKLSAAAKTGNLEQIKTAVNATAGSCKSCHDAFRNR
ncbi:MAG: cytochrome c [Burkholderiaceae bacterium]